jgi:hypothetical protein
MSEKFKSSPPFVRPINSPIFGPKEPDLVLPRRGPQTRTQRGAPVIKVAESAGKLAGGPSQYKPVHAESAGALENHREAAPEREVVLALQAIEQVLSEREQVLNERERKIGERERDLAEAEALLHHHEALMRAARKGAPGSARLSAEEKAAQAALKAELDRQEALLKEAREALREREKFIEASEARLFEKVQEQQEKETELEQREEELSERTRACGPSAGGAPATKRVFDEFNE